MKKLRNKNLIIIITIILFLGILEFTGILPSVLLRVTSSIYVSINYPNRGFKFDNAEYSSTFDSYCVRYKDDDENTLGLMVIIKPFPVFITHDSIKGQP